MDTGGIVVTGIEEVNRMLTDLPAVIVARAFLKALDAGAKVIERGLLERTPERDEGDRREDVPHLIDSIVIEINIDSQLRGGIAKVGFGNMGHVALWVEYGHHLLGHKPTKKELGNVQPYPFMRPTADAVANDVIQAFQDALVEVLTSEVPGFEATFAASGGAVYWFPA